MATQSISSNIDRRPELRARPSPLPVCLVILVSFAVRLVNLEDRSPHYDEIVSMLFGAMPLDHMVYGTAADTMPPLYYSLLHFWLLPGDGLFYARFLSLAFGALSIAVLYSIGKFLFGTKASFLACAVASLSPFHVFYSQEIRMYTTLSLLGLAAVYFFLRWWYEGKRAWWLAYTLSTAISMYVHNLAFVSILSVDLLGFALIMMRRPFDLKRRIYLMAVTHLMVFTLYLPWLLYLPQQLAKVQRAFWIERPGPAEVARSVMVYHFNLPTPSWLLPALLFVSVLLSAFTAYGIYKLLTKGAREERDRLVAGVVLWLAPIIIMLAVSQIRPIYVERAVIVSAFFYYLLLSVAFLSLPRRWLQGLVLALFVPLLLFSLVYHYSYREFPRSPFRELASYLSGVVEEKGFVLHDNKLSYFSTHYYNRGLPQGFIADPPGSPNDTLAPQTMEVFDTWPVDQAEIASANKRVWYVVFDRALKEAEQVGREYPNKLWLDQRYEMIQEGAIGDMHLYLYDTGHPK